jgi:hypothetical protein
MNEQNTGQPDAYNKNAAQNSTGYFTREALAVAILKGFNCSGVKIDYDDKNVIKGLIVADTVINLIVNEMMYPKIKAIDFDWKAGLLNINYDNGAGNDTETFLLLDDHIYELHIIKGVIAKQSDRNGNE